MTGWAFTIQPPGDEISHTVCVAIESNFDAQAKALLRTAGVVISDRPLSDAVLRSLRMKPNDVKVI